MSHVSPGSSSLREGLELFDLELVEAPEVRACPSCGAVTHRADYPRRLSGASGDGKVVVVMRRSPCCSEPGCRKRRQIPSALFLGRCLFPLLQILDDSQEHPPCAFADKLIEGGYCAMATAVSLR